MRNGLGVNHFAHHRRCAGSSHRACCYANGQLRRSRANRLCTRPPAVLEAAAAETSLSSVGRSTRRPLLRSPCKCSQIAGRGPPGIVGSRSQVDHRNPADHNQNREHEQQFQQRKAAAAVARWFSTGVSTGRVSVTHWFAKEIRIRNSGWPRQWGPQSWL